MWLAVALAASPYRAGAALGPVSVSGDVEVLLNEGPGWETRAVVSAEALGGPLAGSDLTRGPTLVPITWSHRTPVGAAPVVVGLVGGWRLRVAARGHSHVVLGLGFDTAAFVDGVIYAADVLEEAGPVGVFFVSAPMGLSTEVGVGWRHERVGVELMVRPTGRSAWVAARHGRVPVSLAPVVRVDVAY